MTVMLLALLFSDSALSSSDASDYSLAPDYEGASSEPHVIAPVRGRAWTPRVEWPSERADCPAFFTGEIEGFGLFRVGPRCADEEIPHAL